MAFGLDCGRPALGAALVGLVLVLAAPAAGQLATSPVEIVVSTAADDANGDVSSVAALKANPGPDGISLREAIEATNNQPGSYDIRFAPALSGATVVPGATCCGTLPPLTGGGVSIDGDINGDGRPDVTLAAGPDGAAGFAFDVVSSNNRLQGLALQGFDTGVVFTAAPDSRALPTGQTFTGNVVSGLVIAATSSGIRIWPSGPAPGHQECVPSACPTHNRWTNTQFLDNTIDLSGSNGLGAIEVALEEVAGDTVDGLTIDGNTIHGVGRIHGIDFAAGGGAHADANTISGVVVSHNSIDAPVPAVGVNTWSGFRGGSNNLVDGFKVTDNTIRFTGTPPSGSESTGIAFAISDDCYPVGCPPGASFPKNNTVQSFEVTGNDIEGPALWGIVVSDLCCGGPTGSRLSDGQIDGNTISTTLPPDAHNPFGIAIGGGAAVSKVVVSGNTVVQQAPGPASTYAAYLAAGGIGVAGGLGKTGGSISDVTITRNRIDTPLAGITVLGGGPSDEAPNLDAADNHVSRITLRQNTIVRAPVLAIRWNRAAKGISIIGGLGGPSPSSGNWPRSMRNSVACVRVKGNVVARKRDAVSVSESLGPHASSNSAQLGGC